MSRTAGMDLICLSHLRWNFVYQRPQHLLSRACRTGRVFFFEEPIFDDGPARLDVRQEKDGPLVATPVLPHGTSYDGQIEIQRSLLDELLQNYGCRNYVTWYYTPMALKFSRHLQPAVCIYDCMDQLSHFLGAPKEISVLEQELFGKADVVFTGGYSLYEAKKDFHPNVHAFPSSVDLQHFGKARQNLAAPADQAALRSPKIGYVGVIDERINLKLIDAVAARRPDWELVMVGPVVKIDPATLPQRPNIHYLGGKTYGELPAYLSGWQVGMLPFALNDATKYISPTKTPEYLAAGLRVVSTSIRDVVNPYGTREIAAIADTAEEFIAAVEQALSAEDQEAWAQRRDRFLSALSWDQTFADMWHQVDKVHGAKFVRKAERLPRPSPIARAVRERLTFMAST